MAGGFDPSAIPSQHGKTILITGATAGLGAASVSALASRAPTRIFLSGRNAKAAEATIAKLRAQHPTVELSFVQMDLTSLDSVRAGARTVLAQTDRLDTVMLNAGVMATAPAVSTDGFEAQWAANVLGHALLVRLLLPLLERTAALPGGDVRVISLSSTAEMMAPSGGIAFDSLHSDQARLGFLVPGGPWARYAQSKLGNLLFARALARHHPTITSISVHPGVIRTGLFSNLTPTARPVGFAITLFSKVTPLEKGWWNQVWAASCPKEELQNGAYYHPVGVLTGGSKTARDDDLAEKLWNWLEHTLGDNE